MCCQSRWTFGSKKSWQGLAWVGICCAWLAVRPADAAVLFSYDASTGQLPSEQGWSAFEIDVDGPLTGASASGAVQDTPEANANTAIELVGGMNALHIRDTLVGAAVDLPLYYYPWSAAEQQSLINGGLRYTVVAQALTNTSSNSNIRLGLNGTLFETMFDNIGVNQSVHVQSFGQPTLFPLDGQFHTLVISGAANGANFDFSYTMDGGAPVALAAVNNPASPTAAYAASVYFGAFSSSGRNSDLLVKSAVMEALIPEPAAFGMAMMAGLAGAVRRNGSRRGQR